MLAKLKELWSCLWLTHKELKAAADKLVCNCKCKCKEKE